MGARAQTSDHASVLHARLFLPPASSSQLSSAGWCCDLQPGGLSFPSGPTSFAACFVVGHYHRRPFLVGAGTAVVLGTAASRVYLGVHHPSDVAMSIVYSIAAASLVNTAWMLLMAHLSERRSGLRAGRPYGGISDAR